MNKNSFYKQKNKDVLPNKMYGNNNSYFNKNNVAGGDLPTLKSGTGKSPAINNPTTGSGMSKYKPPGGYNKYSGGGIGAGGARMSSGLGGGIGGGFESNDPYNMNY